MVEMKDRFKGMHGDLFGGDSAFTLTTPSAEPETNDAEAEAVAALVSLGYKPQEASRMIRSRSTGCGLRNPDPRSATRRHLR